MLKLVKLQNCAFVTKRNTGIVLLLLLICFCVVYKASEWRSLSLLYDKKVVSNLSMAPLHENIVVSNVSLKPLQNNTVVSNVSLKPLHDNRLVSNSSSALRSEVLILWYNHPIWINGMVTFCCFFFVRPTRL